MGSKKGTMVGDPAVSHALNQLTKDGLIDLVHGLAMERLGPGASEAEVVELLQRWVDGVQQFRDEWSFSIVAAMSRYRKLHGKDER